MSADVCGRDSSTPADHTTPKDGRPYVRLLKIGLVGSLLALAGCSDDPSSAAQNDGSDPSLAVAPSVHPKPSSTPPSSSTTSTSVKPPETPAQFMARSDWEALFPSSDVFSADLLIKNIVPLTGPRSARDMDPLRSQRPFLGPLCDSLAEIFTPLVASTGPRPVTVAVYDNIGTEAADDAVLTMTRVMLVPDVTARDYTTMLSDVQAATNGTGNCTVSAIWFADAWNSEEGVTYHTTLMPAADESAGEYPFAALDDPGIFESFEVNRYFGFGEPTAGSVVTRPFLTVVGLATRPDVPYAESIGVGHLTEMDVLVITETWTFLATGYGTSDEALRMQVAETSVGAGAAVNAAVVAHLVTVLP